MKNFVLLAVLLCFSQFLLSQSCLPGGITFITQADVDNFPLNHPTCKVIEGSVYALSSSIQHLNGLGQIEHIGGDLLISGNEQLVNLDGLSKLKTVGMACRIQHNPLLTDLDGLMSLSAVKGDFFYISDNTLLANIEGLAELDSISGIFHLTGQGLLSSLKGAVGVFPTPIFDHDLHRAAAHQLDIIEQKSVSHHLEARKADSPTHRGRKNHL